MSSLPFPSIWVPQRHWFCPNCGKPRLLRRSVARAKGWLRKLIDPIAAYAQGDLMLDASGNLILKSDGTLLLDDGSGNGCCCGVSMCGCSSISSSTAVLTFSGLTYASGCFSCAPSGGPNIILNQTLGTYSIPLTNAPTGGSCQNSITLTNFFSNWGGGGSGLPGCITGGGAANMSIILTINATPGQAEVYVTGNFSVQLFHGFYNFTPSSSCPGSFTVSNNFTSLGCPGTGDSTGNSTPAYGGTCTVTL